MNKALKILLLILGGAFVGFVNGFLGAGGGIIVVPILKYVLGLEVKDAHATAIFVILPLCIVSGIIYIIYGAFNFATFGYVLIGSIIGAVIGSVLLSKLKSNIISYIFSAIIILAGIEVIL